MKHFNTGCSKVIISLQCKHSVGLFAMIYFLQVCLRTLWMLEVEFGVESQEN